MNTIDEVLTEHPRLTARGYDGAPLCDRYEALREELHNATDELTIAMDFQAKCTPTNSSAL